MKTTRSLFAAATLVAAISFATVAAAHDGTKHDAAVEYTGKGELTPVTDKTDAAWIAKARADYPLTTCAVSGDTLEGGDMGKPQEFIYKESGKPDQFVRFCCRDCVMDFKKDPVKYLKVIEEGSAEKKESK